MNSGDDFGANLTQADLLTREAVRGGAELVLLPEKWSYLGPDPHTGAQDLDGPALRWARETAAELRIDLVAGSVLERLGPAAAGRLANTSVHFGPDGSVRALYRKIHMFDVTVDGILYEESAHEQAGSEIVISSSAGGIALGLSVCYDLRFPELYRILTLRGARVLLVPAAFTLATTRDHWEALLRARAIENQSFVLAANQIGPHLPDRRCGGRSSIVDPWGVVVAQAPDMVCQIAATLDLGRQEQIRAELPALRGRRDEVYAWPAAGV